MWQSYMFGSLIAGAFESALDKAGIVRHGSVDSYVATFYRNILFSISIILVGISGILGTFQFFSHWSILLLAPLGVVAALLFTYLLRTVEITGIIAASYLAVFLFLLADIYILGISFTTAQIFGIIFLACGGIAFSLDGKTHHFKRELSWRVSGAMLYIFLFYAALENYSFKYFSSEGVNAVSFYGSVWLVCALILFALVITRGKTRALFSPAAFTYIPYAALGKFFDTFNTILFGTALTMATVAQVNAFNALLPLVVFLTILLTQSLFKIRLKERLDRRNALWKFGAAIVLVVGGILVS